MADYLAAGGTGAEVGAVAPSGQAVARAGTAPTRSASLRRIPARDAMLSALGGEANVKGVRAVASTRLRVEVKNPSAVDEGALVRAGAAGVQRLGAGIIHVVVGPEAPRWAAAIGLADQ